MGKGLTGRPRIRWRDYTLGLAWSHRGVEPAELSEVSENRVIFRDLRLLHACPPQWKIGCENESINKISLTLSVLTVRLAFKSITPLRNSIGTVTAHRVRARSQEARFCSAEP